MRASLLGLLATLLATLNLGISAAAQEQDPVADTIRVDVRLVEVYVTVYDDNGHPIDGLSRDRFRIFEDGKQQTIASFEDNVQSLSCAILLDTTASMKPTLPRAKNSIVKLVDALGDSDSVAIITFDTQISVRQDFTRSKEAAKRAVLRTRAEGSTALFDALAETAQLLGRRPGKKVLIVFTDGNDNASTLNSSSAVDSARKLGIPVFAIAEGEANTSSELVKILKALSERTGGAMYRVPRVEDVDKVFREISQSLQHLYLMSYKQPPGNDSSKWRRIEVDVSGVHAKIRARQGYFPN